MRQLYRPIVFLLALLVVVVAAAPRADAAKAKRHHSLVLSRGYSSIVIDAATGAVLEEDNADAQKYPASLTKMMTLYLVFDALHQGKWTLNTRLPVSAHAASQSPTKLGLTPGDQITVRDVILGMITRSANDAAVVAAEGLGGTEEHFGELMTQRAHRLGMLSTNFHNASGLPDPLQMTTARDLSRLSRALIRDFPQYYGYFSTTEFTYEGQRIANHNHLMSWYEGADGIKTGFISAAGFNLAASAVRDNRRLIGVVLGGPSPVARDHYMAKLLDAAFAGKSETPQLREASATGKRARPTQVAVNDARAAKMKGRHLDLASAAAIPPQTGKPVTDEEHGWGIQVGAFAKIDAARRAAEMATKVAAQPLVGAEIEISTLKHRRGVVHRARLLGLTSEQAHDACRILSRKDRDCQTLSPVDLRSSMRLATN